MPVAVVSTRSRPSGNWISLPGKRSLSVSIAAGFSLTPTRKNKSFSRISQGCPDAFDSLF
jgi:hypothetical protein